MRNQNKLYLILFFALLIRFFLIYLNYQNINFQFQQENYNVYIHALKEGSLGNSEFSPYEKRLFPGYIFLILPATNLIDNPIAIGIVINLILFSVSFFLFWKVFRNLLASTVFAFFPPVWIYQTTKASSEPLTVTLLLTSLFFYKKKLYFASGIILGFAFNVRIISICLLFAYITVFLFSKKFKQIKEMIIGFLITASLLIIYNYLIFGSGDIFIQFTNLDTNYGVVRIGIIQMWSDILRTIDWGQYRILFSGLFYLSINLLTILVLFRIRKKSEIYNICFYWSLFSIMFVFSLSPFTIIENFARYTVPIVPAVAIAITLLILQIKNKLTS